jgi:hypothetical protein
MEIVVPMGVKGVEKRRKTKSKERGSAAFP